MAIQWLHVRVVGEKQLEEEVAGKTPTYTSSTE
jgi:hypothetical protein